MASDPGTDQRDDTDFFIWGTSRRLTCLSFIILFVISLALFSPAWAAAHGQAGVAPDLQEETRKGSPGRSARLVVTLEGADPVQVAARVTELGGKVHGHFPNVGVMALELPLEAVEALAETDGVRYVAPDREVTSLASHVDVTTGANLVYPGALSPTGFDGSGVTVAVIDSGINPWLIDLLDDGTNRRRVVQSVDFTAKGKIDDLFGHGSHVAGIIVGDGSSSYTLGKNYTGMAAAASLLNLRVLDEYGRGYVSNVIAAIDYAISVRTTWNVRVINLSLAAPPIDSYVNDPLCRAVGRAVQAGIVVVASAGNFGQDPYGNKIYGSITSPGISPAAMTVGAVYTRGTNARSDDVIAPFSSRGPTLSHSTNPITGTVVYDNLAKPDLVAPGARIVSLERDNNYLVTTYPAIHVDGTKTNSRYMMLSGTSMSAGVVSGAAALMLQANPSLTPNQVKAILMYTAQIMNGPDLFEQGAGLLNVDGAVRVAAAMSSKAATAVVGQKLVTGQGLPAPQSVIAGETVAWSQSLIWGFGALRGQAVLTTQQTAYTQSLIWGIGRLDAWGAGVTYYDGLYSSSYVAFGGNNQWNYITWDSGTPTASGLIWTRELYASGLIWGNRIISSDFFDCSSSSLIWGINGYGRYDAGLIWSINGAGLIWGKY